MKQWRFEIFNRGQLPDTHGNEVLEDIKELGKPKLFFGISNHFIYGLSEGYQQYFESWPILPNGEYEVRASLSAYQNENYEMLSHGVQETIIFQYS